MSGDGAAGGLKRIPRTMLPLAFEFLALMGSTAHLGGLHLTLNRAGDVVLQLKSPYHDGTTHVVMSPLELMQRLAALVQRPRLHLISFHGGRQNAPKHSASGR